MTKYAEVDAPSYASDPVVPEYGPNFRARRRAFIARRLETHYPFKVTYIYAAIFILIGFAQIGLQIYLITQEAYNWQICNGIWGGVFCIFVSILNLNLTKKPSYWKYFFTLLTTGLMSMAFAAAFVVVPAITLEKYEKCNSTESQCLDDKSKQVTTAILGIGMGTIIANPIYIITFQTLLVGGCETLFALSSVPNCP